MGFPIYAFSDENIIKRKEHDPCSKQKMGEKMKKHTHSRIFKMWYRNLKSSMNRGNLYFEH